MKDTTPNALFGDFETYKPKPAFGGSTFSPADDAERLEWQLNRVFQLMRDGEWRTFEEIRAVTGGSEAGISARLRDFRKTADEIPPPYCGHRVDKRRRGDAAKGIWEYRVLVRSGG